MKGRSLRSSSPNSSASEEKGSIGGRNHRGGDCHVSISIEARGDVVINNCCAAHPEAQPSPEDCFSPKRACMPVVPGAKHKQSRDQKLASLAAGTRVPSALAAGAIHMMRRFLADRSPATPIENKIFALLEKMPRSLVSCTLDAFDQMAPAQRVRLFASSLSLGVNQPLDETKLSQALAAEIVQRVGEQLFDDPSGGEMERPGQIRVFPPEGEDPFEQVRICSVNDVRSAVYVPPIDINDRLPHEIQRDCAPQIVDGETQVVCVPRTTNCPGRTLGPVCARVLDVAQGEAVTLQGVNYFSTEAVVRMISEDGALVRDVDVHVWGDIDTPVTEMVNGETRLINDCRVHDQIVLRVPEDLPPGLWQIRVVVPNSTGIPEFGAELLSNTEFLNVLVPETARFQVGIDSIIARQETSPDWAGSDELGLQVFAGAMDADFNPVVLNMAEGETTLVEQYRGDFDTGTYDDINRTVFATDQPFVAIVIAVFGDEVDSEGFYSGEMHSRLGLFGEILFIEFGLAATAFKIAGLTLAGMGTLGLVLTGAGAAVLIGLAAAIALWAPADPIIRDSLVLTINDLAKFTSFSLPPPEGRSFTSSDSITVNVNKTIPPKKLPFHYLETREYVGKDSRYEIIYRFHRLA